MKIRDELMRRVLLIIGIIFITIGAYRDEVTQVLIKSINICLECIGIG